MAAEDNSVQRKTKFKITTKGIRDDSRQKTCEKVAVKNGQRCQVNEAGKENPKSELLVKSTMPTSTKKRGPDSLLEGQRGKSRRMDRSVKLQCGSILKELMNHPKGWIFNEPVDPVKWSIPDYFSIVKKPMDLGTIKHKLEGNLYFNAEEFADDVRLTFFNAMLYNPPADGVHITAKLFNGTFNKKWKSLEAKLKTERANLNGQDSNKTVEKSCHEIKQNGLNRAPMDANLSNNRPMSLKENHKIPTSLWETKELKFERVKVSKGTMTEKLQYYIDGTDDETLLKLRSELKKSIDARKVESVKMAQNESNFMGQSVRKENRSGSGASTKDRRQTIDSTAAKCSYCGGLMCRCRVKNASVQASLSDISSERSQEHDPFGYSRLDLEVKNPSKFYSSRLGSDSDGPGLVPDEESCVHHLSTPSTTSVSGEGWSSFDFQMSPKRALRAAILKSRYARTIYKATHQDENSDPVKMKREEERLEREQLEEKARIENEIKMAEEAKRMKREREREAARIALQKMEKSVEIYENLNILKELELLCCASYMSSSCGSCGSPLAQLGLYLKDDDYMEEDSVLNLEEGEILL